MAAYCVVRGIDYIVEECPMAAGNKHLGYKEALNAIEASSPGAKHAFYHEFLARAADHFESDDHAGVGGACIRCGSPSTNEICAFCTLLERTQGAEPVTVLPTRRGR
jgi:tRNA(Ile)-lysidine synthase TilS/MesJ